MATLSKPMFSLPPHTSSRLKASISTHRRPLVLAFLILLLLRSRVVTGTQSVLGALKSRKDALGSLRKKKKLTKEELAKVLQQVYVDEEDGSKTLLVPYQERVIRVPIHPTPKSQYLLDQPHFPPLPTQTRQKPNIDRAFLAQLRSILFRIAVPSWRSPEAGIIALHSFFLVLRTVLSIAVARLDGRIVRDLVRADAGGFLRGLGLWFLLAVPSTFTNSMIRHLQSLLSLRLRTRLTRYLHDLYLSSNPDIRYYRASNYLEGVAQYLTADVEAWANAASGLYGNLLKPSLDLLLFTSQLSRSLGVRGTVLLFANYYATVAILRAVTPAFGRLAATEAKLEGEYRAGMGRVGREAEEIAFYDGGAREKDILTKAYMRLIKHVNSIYRIRIAYEWTEDYVIKYLWSAAGYALIAVPILYTRTKRSLGIQVGGEVERSRVRDDAIAGRTETYISNRRLLLSLADAGGRMMYAYKDLLELAGLTTRLYVLISTLLNLPKGVEPLYVERGGAVTLEGVDVRVPRVRASGIGEQVDGEKGDEEENEDEPPLVKDLSLTIKPGEHLMITGDNGVGKTAVARVLAGLWDPSGSGTVKLPRDGEDESSTNEKHPTPANRARPTLYVVPQRSYMVTGSLLEQIIYPCSYAAFLRLSLTRFPAVSAAEALALAEAELQEVLEKVFLGYLVEREGGMGARKEWRDVLSGGEKQRMGIARVLWWRPKFAVLDECTSAVSGDVEGRMYEAAKALGITLITISLRPSLTKYHVQLLTLSGPSPAPTTLFSSSPSSSSRSSPEPTTTAGKWILTRVGTKEERMGVDREIAVLEAKLRAVEEWEGRVEELERLLGVREGQGEEVVDDVDDVDESEDFESVVEVEATELEVGVGR
ncbi:ABC transporter transmembrane region 2-domain-containing protein [Crassisporium funariophilum]|nr:ABC transporter transmembrane region 2-domain-containing protein [Crassisporium funariophilum]